MRLESVTPSNLNPSPFESARARPSKSSRYSPSIRTISLWRTCGTGDQPGLKSSGTARSGSLNMGFRKPSVATAAAAIASVASTESRTMKRFIDRSPWTTAVCSVGSSLSIFYQLRFAREKSYGETAGNGTSLQKAAVVLTCLFGNLFKAPHLRRTNLQRDPVKQLIAGHIRNESLNLHRRTQGAILSHTRQIPLCIFCSDTNDVSIGLTKRAWIFRRRRKYNQRKDYP
mmetsp:Transcript_22853/g.38173  ORF Transcript_22853/g.38173 Transcript_22853/m.38173 type:complete len:229 (+) Transcript_22853:2309-2995(+)